MHNLLTKKTIAIIIAITLVIAAAVSITTFSHSSGDSKEVFEKGNQLYEEKKYQEAIEAYNEAIKINPQDSSAYNNKGNALYNLGKYQEAIEAYNEAIKINPQDSSAYNNKGVTLRKLGKYQEAIEAYNEAIKINPQDSSAYNNKGNTLSDLGKYQEAIEAYNETIKINPQDSRAYYNKGVALSDLGKYQEAIEAYNEAIKINPQYADAYDNKGVALGILGKYLEALEASNEAIKINPHHANAHHNKGVALKKLGRNLEATEAFDEEKRINAKKSEEVDDSQNHLNPSPLGIKLNQDTLKEVAKKYKIVQTTSHYIKGYNNHDLDLRNIDIDTLTSAGFITDKDQVVVLFSMLLSKEKFNETYDTLKSKYKLISSQIPYVGDKHAKFEAGNCFIVIDCPHLSFKTSVSYITKEFSNKTRDVLKEENQAKEKKNQDMF